MLGRMDLRTGCWVREVCALRELDEVVRPTLRTKFRLGLFDHATPDKMIWEKLPENDTTESRALARKVEVEGAVLLRNDGHILPLNKDLKTIAVIGPNADLGQTGDYSPKPSPNQLVTVPFALLFAVVQLMRNVPRVVRMQHCGPVHVRLVPLLRRQHPQNRILRPIGRNDRCRPR
jgi:beta-glucosidase-like glycosyl hydrolase